MDKMLTTEEANDVPSSSELEGTNGVVIKIGGFSNTGSKNIPI